MMKTTDIKYMLYIQLPPITIKFNHIFKDSLIFLVTPLQQTCFEISL